MGEQSSTPSLDEILNSVGLHPTSCFAYMSERPCNCGLDKDIEKAKSAILLWARGLVPPEDKSTCVCDRGQCFNDCREQVLSNIEEAGK